MCDEVSYARTSRSTSGSRYTSCAAEPIARPWRERMRWDGQEREMTRSKNALRAGVSPVWPGQRHPHDRAHNPMVAGSNHRDTAIRAVAICSNRASALERRSPVLELIIDWGPVESHGSCPQFGVSPHVLIERADRFERVWLRSVGKHGPCQCHRIAADLETGLTHPLQKSPVSATDSASHRSREIRSGATAQPGGCMGPSRSRGHQSASDPRGRSRPQQGKGQQNGVGTGSALWRAPRAT